MKKILLIPLALALGLSVMGCSQEQYQAATRKSNSQGLDTTEQTGNGVQQGQDPLTSEQEQQALAQIAQMTQQQCQENFQRVIEFYQTTKNMTEQERKAYFESLIEDAKRRGQPAPPPPPAPGSKIFVALENCAKGTK